MERKVVLKQGWKEAATVTGNAFPLERFHAEVREWIEREAGGKRQWAIACSGGADSLLLLLALYTHYPELRERMLVLHFNHRMRGNEADADARFVEEVAGALELAVSVGVWRDRPAGPVSEAAARDARFAFVEEALAGCEKPVLFLGHQRDDILETQLMRLCRGSGSLGMAAPRPVVHWRRVRVHLRPLLDLSAREIREHLTAHAIPFREDASNETEKYFRNRLRLSVVPVLREVAPIDPDEGAALSRRLMAEEDEALRYWLREVMGAIEGGRPLSGKALAGKPSGLWRRALDAWMNATGIRENFSRSGFEAILEAWKGGSEGRFSGGSEKWLLLRGSELSLQESLPRWEGLKKPWPLPPGATLFFPGGRSLTRKWAAGGAELLQRLESGAVDCRREVFLASAGECEPLWVRHWQAGDRYRPLGSPGRRKLQDCFTDRRVPVAERTQLPVVFSGGHDILWGPGLPPAEARRVNSTTKGAVWLTYRMPKPA